MVALRRFAELRTTLEPEQAAPQITSDKVVRPIFAQRRAAEIIDQLPDIEALFSVALDRVKVAQDRAIRAEQGASEFASRVCAQLEQALAQLCATRSKMKVLEGEAKAAVCRAAGQQASAEARTGEALDRLRILECENVILAGRLAKSEMLIEEYVSRITSQLRLSPSAARASR